MTSAAQAAGASGEVTINGRVYTMHPLTGRDFGELDNWIRLFIIQNAAEASRAIGVPSVASDVLDSAMRVAASASFYTTAGQQVIRTPHGTARLIYQSIKRAHPQANYQEIWDWVRDPDNMDAASRTFEILNSSAVAAGKKQSGPEGTSPPTSAPSTGG